MRSSRSKREKDITYILLSEAVTKEDCPVCFLLARKKEVWVEDLLYWHVNDQHVRREIRSKGLCTRHLWDILEYSEKHPSISVLGGSIILQDVLELQLEELVKTESIDDFWGMSCILCCCLKEAEESNLTSLSEWFKEGELLKLYGRSPSILCLNHLKATLKRLDEKNRKSLLSIQLSKLVKLNENLKSFIKKFDWNVNEKQSHEEVAARELAAIVLRGKVC
ncbi:MAG: DUF6062 family protein [Candidatus Bathyarchaeia archaeon]